MKLANCSCGVLLVILAPLKIGKTLVMIRCMPCYGIMCKCIFLYLVSLKLIHCLMRTDCCLRFLPFFKVDYLFCRLVHCSFVLLFVCQGVLTVYYALFYSIPFFIIAFKCHLEPWQSNSC